MARPRPVDSSRNKLLNKLGMFRQLETYENTTTQSYRKKKKNSAHGDGNDTNGFRPIKPQHIRHHSEMSSFLHGSASSGASGQQHNTLNASAKSASTVGPLPLPPPVARPTRSALHNCTGYFETTLNDMNDEDAAAAADCKNSNDNDNNQNDAVSDDSTGGRNRLRFHAVVSVVEIPSHTQYSSRMKSSLWRDRHELNEMVQRNITEFHYENYDWKSVIEEADFYVDGMSGERVHPAHFMLDDNDEDGDEGEEGQQDNNYANEALSRDVGESKQSEVIQITSNFHGEADGPVLHRSTPAMMVGGVDAAVLAEKLAAVAVMVDEKENSSTNSSGAIGENTVASNDGSNQIDLQNSEDGGGGDDDDGYDDHFFLPLRRYDSQKLQ